MKPKDIFKLAVRLLGLVFLYQGLSGIPQFLMFFPPSNVQEFFTYLLHFGWPLLVAFWLLCGAPPIVRLAYPDSES